jgi:hypothetical protein
MSKSKKGANAQFTSTGKGLTIIGDCCYAYSGELSADDNETIYLLFQTGKEIIKGTLQFNATNELSQEFRYRIYFNGLQVQSYLAGNNAPDYRSKPDTPIPLVIPPLTEVKVTAINLDDSVSGSQICSLTGRVYG